MLAYEFETDIVGEYVRIPEFNKLKGQHVRVILLAESKEDKMGYDFSDIAGKLSWDGDALLEQKRLRNEWE